jgi:diguanylate cyclase (GGDEF)-like protein/PAS domain S-box-containing protein
MSMPPRPDAFETAFAYAPLGMALVGTTGCVEYANAALCRLVGHEAEAICARPFSALSDPCDVEVDERESVDLIAGRIEAYHVEKRYVHAKGHRLWVLVSVSLVRDDGGAPLLRIVQVQDISARKELEGRLEHLVDHDLLTGRLNAQGFEKALTRETRAAARYGGGGAVLLLDLDHFKEVNDQFGHKAGDGLLRTVATVLRDRIRETDVLARLGGDEFGILLPRVNAAQAQASADGLVKALRRHTATLAER